MPFAEDLRNPRTSSMIQALGDRNLVRPWPRQPLIRPDGGST